MGEDRHKPFVEKYEFTGRIESNGESVGDVFFDLEYSTIKEGEIKATLYGSLETRDRLDRVVFRRGPVTVASTNTDVFTDEISSKEAYLHIHGQHYGPERVREASREIGRITFGELEIVVNHRGGSEHKQVMTFFLTGPTYMWPVRSSTEYSFQGSVRSEISHSSIDLGEQCPFNIEARPHYLFHTPEFPEKRPVQMTDIMSMEFSKRRRNDDFANGDFVSVASEVAEDIILLISFLSKQWCAWFRYHVVDNASITRKVRHSRDCTSRLDPWERGHIKDLRKPYLRTGYEALLERREAGIDLRLPITYYLVANEASYLEEQFTGHFLALESLNDLHREMLGSETLLSKEHFGPLKDAIKKWVKKEVSDASVREMITAKTNDLNRLTIRAALRKLLRSYDLDWTDLYPGGVEATFVTTRNRLFHTAKGVEIGLLARENERVRILVERIILAALGLIEDSVQPDPVLIGQLKARI